MIKKELLEKVLGISIEKVLEENYHIAFRIHPDGQTVKINYYEFANKCKLWALNLDEYTIESGLTWGEGYVNLFGRYACSDSEPDEIFVEDSEPKAIFKACEWILKEQK